jgi:hypothetical protein
MTYQTIILAALGLSSLSLSACQPPGMPPSPAPSPADPPKMSANFSSSSSSALHTAQEAGSSAAAYTAEIGSGLRVDIYQLQVPLGTISRNTEFWKHVDEHSVDPGTYDVLLKNGVRVGQAPVGEWDYFREIMSRYPALTKQTSLVAAESKPVELKVVKEQPFQDLWYFDSAGRLQGQSFDAAENLIALSFQQAPRKSNTMRVTMCPLVRSKQKRLEYSPLNNEMEVTYTHPQRLYNLNLRTDVSAERFLIVAPSGESTWRSSVGNNFFVIEGDTERMENVLLIIPAPIKLERVPTPPYPATPPTQSSPAKK